MTVNDSAEEADIGNIMESPLHGENNKLSYFSVAVINIMAHSNVLENKFILASSSRGIGVHCGREAGNNNSHGVRSRKLRAYFFKDKIKADSLHPTQIQELLLLRTPENEERTVSETLSSVGLNFPIEKLQTLEDQHIFYK
ncbi:hypothetical protein STEG23_035291 [Scotinomys teguina]